MKNKIILIGRMASGKTTMADRLCEEFGFQKFSLADKIKEIARDLFGMTEKDRTLLQKLGYKIREIEPMVWCNYLERKLNVEHENQSLCRDCKFVIDDVRFLNEYDHFLKLGWFPIKFEVPKEIRLRRIRELYGEIKEEQLVDPTEIEIDQIYCPNVIFEKKYWTIEDKWKALLGLVEFEKRT